MKIDRSKPEELEIRCHEETEEVKDIVAFVKSRQGRLTGNCVFVIYVLTHVIEWYQNSVTAKKMTEELLIFQKKYEQG